MKCFLQSTVKADEGGIMNSNQTVELKLGKVFLLSKARG